MVENHTNRLPTPEFIPGKENSWVAHSGGEFLPLIYMARNPLLQEQIQAIAGAKDRIAPSEGCRALVNSLGSIEKSFVLCSKESGYQEDYTHPRLIASQNAKKEIWPMILAFIRAIG